MAAIPNAGGAKYAPHGVLRALMRLVVLGALVAAGWLLSAGTGHADEDLGLPGAGLTHLVNPGSADDSSGDQFGVPSSVGPVVKQVLSRPSVPQPSVQPPVKVGILQPALNAVSGSKPLTKVLIPVLRPVSGPTPHRAAGQPAVPVDRPAAILPSSPSATAPAVTAAPTPAVPALAPVRTATPLVAQLSHAENSPAKVAPAPVLTSSSESPVAPLPASPLGNTPSSCMTGGSGGGTGTKNTTDVAVRDGWTMEDLVPQRDLHSCDTRDVPRSLSAQPSTSPD